MGQEPQYQYNSQYNGQYQQYSQPRGVRDTRLNHGVIGIIATCIAMMVWMYVDTPTAANLWMWPNENLRIWQFVTSVFFHGGFSHLFWNMFMLYMFGMALENMLETQRFIGLFVLAGIVGNIGYVIFCVVTGSDTPAVGASGAIYGIFACLAIMRPDMKVYFFFAIPMKIVHALMFYAAIDIVFLGADDNIAHAAHIAGLAAGLAIGYYVKSRQPARPKVQYAVQYR